MKIEGSFTLQEPIDKVWTYFVNIEEISRCIPGIDMFETIDSTHFQGVLQVKIGPIKAAFGGKVTLIELESPHRLVAEIEADDKRNASKLKATFVSILNPVASGTEVSYRVDVHLRGRLARFGQAVVQGTAKTMIGVFSDCVRKKLIAR